MPDLSQYKVTREVMERHNLQLRKNLGQNFLVDPLVLSRIMESIDLNKDETVLEVGAGMGTLTVALAKEAGEVITWEIDKQMFAPLEENLSAYPHVTVIKEDFLETELTFLETKKNLKICANLPYYITSPIIMKFLESNLDIDKMVVMVQKEVGDRMRAEPGTPEYSSFTAVLSYYADIKQVANVPVNSFIPRPAVNSAVMELNIYDEPPVKVDNEEVLFDIIKAAFSQRRKTLLNCLSNAPYLKPDKKECRTWMEEAGIDLKIRGERLSIEDFAKLANSYPYL